MKSSGGTTKTTNKWKKKTFKFLFIQTFKSITRSRRNGITMRKITLNQRGLQTPTQVTGNAEGYSFHNPPFGCLGNESHSTSDGHQRDLKARTRLPYLLVTEVVWVWSGLTKRKTKRIRDGRLRPGGDSTPQNPWGDAIIDVRSAIRNPKSTIRLARVTRRKKASHRFNGTEQSKFFISTATSAMTVENLCNKKGNTHEIIRSNSGTKDPSNTSTIFPFSQAATKSTWDPPLKPTKETVIIDSKSRTNNKGKHRGMATKEGEEEERLFTTNKAQKEEKVAKKNK